MGPERGNIQWKSNLCQTYPAPSSIDPCHYPTVVWPANGEAASFKLWEEFHEKSFLIGRERPISSLQIFTLYNTAADVSNQGPAGNGESVGEENF